MCDQVQDTVRRVGIKHCLQAGPLSLCGGARKDIALSGGVSRHGHPACTPVGEAPVRDIAFLGTEMQAVQPDEAGSREVTQSQLLAAGTEPEIQVARSGQGISVGEEQQVAGCRHRGGIRHAGRDLPLGRF